MKKMMKKQMLLFSSKLFKMIRLAKLKIMKILKI